MPDAALPHPNDLMLPTLRAVIDLGGSGSNPDIDNGALEEAHISDDQKAVVYGPDATATGPKILHRIAWARTMLKRIGALESTGYGNWTVTDWGNELGTMPDCQARSQILESVSVAYQKTEPTAETLAVLRGKADAGEPASMTVRDLIGMWGVSRRRTGVIERIGDALSASGLATDPDFTSGGLDSKVEVVVEQSSPPTAPSDTPDSVPPSSYRDVVTLVVGNIPSATTGIKSINPQHDLLAAQSEMQANDYSQLAVMEGQHKLVGAITWESIAKAMLVSHEAKLPDCIDHYPKTVRLDQPLLDAVPDISEAGYVFVEGPHNTYAGIITVADLSDQFAELTRPFLLIGEIERLLRSAIDRHFDSDDLYESLDPDDDREVQGAHSLALGEVQYLLQSSPNFERLGWLADRGVFSKHLDEVRMIRNEVMHFSPDPIAESDIKSLTTFAAWVRTLESHSA